MGDLYTVETIKIDERLRVRIVSDPEPMSPAEWDNVGAIAYLERSHYVLGTEGVSQDRMDEIATGLRDGSLIGMPVYAYVHSGATIWTGETRGWPFDCPWDSGMSGFVYCTPERALEACGKPGQKRVTKRIREQAIACLRAEVKQFDMYLTGDVYGFIVETRDDNGDWNETDDTLWGLYGLDYAREEATDTARWRARRLAHEAHDEWITARLHECAIDAHMAGL